MRPCLPVTPGMSIHVWSVVNPVAHTTASYVAASPSAKVTVRPAALVARGRRRMPWRWASRRGPGPITWSRPARRPPSREPAVTRASPPLLAHHHTSPPHGRRGKAGGRWPDPGGVGRRGVGTVSLPGGGGGGGGEGRPGRVVVRGWGEQPQQPPPRAPQGPDPGAGVHDRKRHPALCQVVAHGQATLAAAD